MLETFSRKGLLRQLALAIWLGALLLAGPAFAQGPDEGVRVFSLTQRDLSGDGAPDLTIIDCAFVTEHDRVLVYDRGGDMQISKRWDEATDFENDLWVFDAGTDGQVELIIDFHRTPEGLVATMWDDQDGDGTVLYQDWPELTVRESKWPTVIVTAPDGWWIREGKINFNLKLAVDGPVVAAFQSPIYIQYLQTDGVPDFLIEVRDTDRDGRPDIHWIDAWPEAPAAWGIHRTELMVNPTDDEPPIQGSIFWPLLGTALEVEGPRGKRPARFLVSELPAQKGFGFSKAYNLSFPPIQVAWHKAAIAYVGEFVASRFNDASWFVYSIHRVREGEASLVNFEAPFAFYDLAKDDDGFPELSVRLEHALPHDLSLYWFAKANLTNITPLQRIRYSWDQDNNRSWDYKLGLVGRYAVSGTIRVDDLLLLTVPPALLPKWVNEHTWDGVTFVAAETDDVWDSEGINEWEISELWRDGYVTGLLDTPPEKEYQTIEPGFRGEYAFDFRSRPVIYLSPIDHKLHLKGATRGVWNIGGTTEIRYADLDHDGYMDQWTYARVINDTQTAPVMRQLNVTDSYLVYSNGDEVILRRAKVKPSLFETLPPTTHEEWLKLGRMLEAHRFDIAPGDFEAMLMQFDGPLARFQGASLREFRLTEGGFRFVLKLEPGFRYDSELAINGLSDLKAGAYLVRAFGETLSLTPLTPPVLSIRGNRLELGTQEVVALTPVRVKAVVENRGLQDVQVLHARFYAEREGEEELLDATQVSVPGEGSAVVSTLWAPMRPGEWTIRVEVEAEDEGLLPGGTVRTSAVVHVTVRPISEPDWPEFLALGGNLPSRGMPLVFLVVSIIIASIALFLLLTRKAEALK